MFQGKAAVIWMIGEYGDLLPVAPYVLETLIDTFTEESAITVRVELLSAAMKLFFKRPPEMQKMLGRYVILLIHRRRPHSPFTQRRRLHNLCFILNYFISVLLYSSLLKKAIDDVGNVDVRDRALMYYRLLKFDVLEV